MHLHKLVLNIERSPRQNSNTRLGNKFKCGPCVQYFQGSLCNGKLFIAFEGERTECLKLGRFFLDIYRGLPGHSHDGFSNSCIRHCGILDVKGVYRGGGHYINNISGILSENSCRSESS